jgi:2-hydroxy-3-keto-5-methylthiopentenyl-1-phosphate phosphatase
MASLTSPARFLYLTPTLYLDINCFNLYQKYTQNNGLISILDYFVNMSSTLRSKAINTFEDLLKNKNIEITLKDFTSIHGYIKESTDPLLMVSRFIMSRMLMQLL